MLVTTLGYGAGDTAIEIGEEDAAFASQMRIFDRPRWWEKPEMP